MAACLVDRFGRVPLLLASNAGIAFSQALLPTAYYLLPLLPTPLPHMVLEAAAGYLFLQTGESMDLDG